MIKAFCYSDESYVGETEDGYISVTTVTEDYTCTVPGELYDISVTIAAGSYGEHGEDEDDGSWHKFYYIEATVDGTSNTLSWEEEGYNYEYTSVDITLDGEEVPYWGELYSDSDDDSSDAWDYESHAIPELDESYDSGAFDGTVTTGLSLIESILALQEEAEEYATSNCSAHHEDDVYIESWDSYADSVTYYFTDEDSDGEYDSGETCILVKILYSGSSLYVYNYTSGSIP